MERKTDHLHKKDCDTASKIMNKEKPKLTETQTYYEPQQKPEG